MAKKGQGKKKAYSGALSTPILLDDPRGYRKRLYPESPYFKTDEAQQAEQDEIRKQYKEKLPLLFKQYDIPDTHPHKWQFLALALAQVHVPGFKVVHKQGAPVTLSMQVMCDFYRAFCIKKSARLAKQKRKISDSEIIQALLKDEDFKKAFPKFKGTSAKRLQNLLSDIREMRRQRVKYMRQACKVKKTMALRPSEDDFHYALALGDPPPWLPAPYNIKTIPER